MIYQHILVAVDQSNASNLALQEAVRLAKDQNAKLRIIYIAKKPLLNRLKNAFLLIHFGAFIKKKDRVF
ncbi:universal stress protein [Legionella pneumophila serogroup 2]|nr:universal stress protein [Legionella pneumophila]